MPCCFMSGVCLTHPVLFVSESLSYSYTPCAILCVRLTHHVLFYVESVSYTPCAILCGEFVLHTLFYFMW